jgi:hypothetical protein
VERGLRNEEAEVGFARFRSGSVALCREGETSQRERLYTGWVASIGSANFGGILRHCSPFCGCFGNIFCSSGLAIGEKAQDYGLKFKIQSRESNKPVGFRRIMSAGSRTRTTTKGDCPRSIRKHLSPSQWLPKPATRWLPHKNFALRSMWSPLHSSCGEGERQISGFRRVPSDNVGCDK